MTKSPGTGLLLSKGKSLNTAPMEGKLSKRRELFVEAGCGNWSISMPLGVCDAIIVFLFQ